MLINAPLSESFIHLFRSGRKSPAERRGLFWALTSSIRQNKRQEDKMRRNTVKRVRWVKMTSVRRRGRSDQCGVTGRIQQDRISVDKHITHPSVCVDSSPPTLCFSVPPAAPRVFLFYFSLFIFTYRISFQSLLRLQKHNADGYFCLWSLNIHTSSQVRSTKRPSHSINMFSSTVALIDWTHTKSEPSKSKNSKAILIPQPQHSRRGIKKENVSFFFFFFSKTGVIIALLETWDCNPPWTSSTSPLLKIFQQDKKMFVSLITACWV